MSVPKRPRIVAVCGGKGGVGKSTIAVNLALAMGRLGHKVVLVDADLGAANLHTMLGVVRPTRGLGEFIDHTIETLDEARLQVSVPTVTLVPGTSRPGAANINHGQKLRLLRAISKLDTDCVIVDVGAGTSYHVVDLVAIADIKLFVVTPQLPSLHNAYALLKACVHRVVSKMSDDDYEQRYINQALASERGGRTIPQLLSDLRPVTPDLADKMVDALLRFGVGLVGNQIGTDADEGVLRRMSTMIYDHLLIHAPVMGVVRRSPALTGGLTAGANTVVDRSDDVYPQFRKLAATVLELDLDRLRGTSRTGPQRTMPLWVMRETNPG
jgi:flagellar biosynthesis protein FlhG